MKKKNKSLAVLGLAILVGVSSVLPQPLVFQQITAEAANPTTTVNFEESSNQTMTKTITIPNLVSVESITTNTGSVSYSKSGDNLTITVSGGSPSRTVNNPQKYSKQVTNSRTSTTNSFPATNPYSSGGYAGTLAKSGGSYVASGTYTAAVSKTVTGQTSASYNVDGYTGTLTPYVYSGSYTPAETKYVRKDVWVEQDRVSLLPPAPSEAPETYFYNEGGYSGYLVKQGEIWNERETSGGFSGTPYWIQTYHGDVTKPAIDTRVYRYQGTVTKPAVDTRVYGQNYAGTAYMAGNDYFYSYNVQVEYVNDNVPPTPATFTADKTGSTNSNVIVTANFPTDAATKQVSVNGGSWTAYTGPITFTGNGALAARSYDAAGNLSSTSTYSVSNIDKSAPATPTLAVNTTSPTNGNVSVTITFPSDAATKQYRINSGTWTTYSSAVSMTANGTVEARAIDAAGNISATGTRSITNIDKSAPATPSLTASTTAATNGNVTVTAGFPSDSTQKQISVNGGAWTTYSTAITFTENGSMKARAIDAAGNISAEDTITISNIDKTAPTTPSLSPSTTSPTNGNVSVTISYPSDAAAKEYRINGGTWTTYTTAVTMTANGTVEARAIDAVGNISATGSRSVTNIDKTAPGTPTLSASTTAPTNGNVSVTASFPSDAAQEQVSVNGGAWTAYTAAITFTANGSMKARAIDAAGNISAERTLSISNIDKSAPTTPTLAVNTTSPTNGNVSVTITFPSDAVTEQYRINGGTWTAYTTAITMTANGTVEARAIDNAGNISATGSRSVTNIDKSAPATPGLSASTTSPTNGNVSVTATFPSDADQKQISVNGGAWTAYTAVITFTSNGSMKARAIDAAGNISAEQSISVANIDKTAPTTPTLAASTTSPTNGNVSVTISYPADAATEEYRINGGAWTAYTAAITMTANGTVEARATDAVGNISAIGTRSVANIDKVAPAIPTLSASTSDPTNENVLVTATFPSDAEQKQVSVNGGTWTAYTTAITFTSNGTLKARSIDAAGNVSSERTISVSNIDKMAPTTPGLSASTTAPTNGNVTVTATFPSDAEQKQVSVNGGSWIAYTAAVSFSANGTMKARAIDNAGNISAERSISITNIDKVAPTTPNIVSDTASRTNQDVNLNVTFPSDSVKNEVRVNGGSWVVYTTAIVFSENGKLEARSTDAAGNLSAIGSFDVINIDKTAPAAATLSADVTGPTNKNVTVSIVYPAKGETRQYKIGSGAWQAYTVPVSLSENGSIHARSIDDVGNISELASYHVTNIDKVAPATPTVSPSTTSPTNSNVSVTITFPNDAVSKEYRINGGTWTAYTAALSIAVNSMVEARAIDAAGNISVVGNHSVSNIDKVAPTTPGLTPSTTAPTNGNVSVTATFPSDAAQKQVSVNGGAWTAYTTAITFTENGSMKARAIDNAGNVSAEKTISVSNIDKVAPAVPGLSASTTAPTNGNVSVTATFPSDAAQKQFSVNGGAWTAYTTAITFTENGTMKARSIDDAGNISAERSVSVTNIDKTAPVTPGLSASTTAPTNGTVTVTATFPSDAVNKEVSINGGDWTAYTAPIVLSANGTVKARAIDNAANVSAEKSISVTNIDKVAPNKPVLTANTTAPSNKDITITATFPSDAEQKQVSINGGSWTAYTTPVVLTANGDVKARAIDDAGNISSIETMTISNIDKVAPITPNIVSDTAGRTNQDVSLTAAFPSDSVKNEIRVNGGTWKEYTEAIVFSENGKLEARSIDAAGNVSAVRVFDVTNIDKTAPAAATLSADLTGPTNKNVTVTIAYPVKGETRQYKIGSGEWKTYTVPVEFSANGSIHARSIDDVGNISELASYHVTNIDKVAPVKASLAADKTGPTNQSVTVSASFPADALVKEVRVNAGEWMAYTKAVVFTDNGSVEVRSTDDAGNTSAVAKYDVTNIDKVAPVKAVLTADVVNPTNKAVTVSASFPTDALVKEVKIGNGEWALYTKAIVFTDNGSVEVRSTDDAGNTSAITKYEVTNIDKVAPVKATLQADVTGPTNKPVTVTPTFPTDAYVKEVKVNNGEWTAYTEAIVFTDNGSVEVRSTDDANNTSEITKYNVTNIDKVAPVAAGLEPNTKAPTNQDVTVEATFPSDAHIKEVKVNDGEWAAYTKAIVFAENGSLEVRSTDDAGNTSAITKYSVTNIDKVAPNQPSAVSSNTAPTKDALQVTATFPADADQKEYKTTSGDWTAYTGPVTMEANDTLTFRATDDAGNTSQSDFVIENFDFVAPDAPAFSFAIDTVSMTDGKDSHQVKESRYRLAGETDWNVYTESLVFKDGEHHLELVTVDSVGNVSDITNAKFHAYRSQLKVATDATIWAETAPTYHSRIQAARLETAKLPDAAPEKTTLNERLQKQENLLNLKDATTKVELAERYKKEPYLQNAQDSIDQITETPERAALQERLDAVKQAIADANYVDPNAPDGEFEEGGSILDAVETVKDEEARYYLKRWVSAITSAEKYYSRISIVNAVSRMNETPAGVLQNQQYTALINELASRTTHLKNAWNEGVENREIEYNMANAFRLVDYLEGNNTEKSLVAAQAAVDALPEGDTRQALQVRVDRVAKVLAADETVVEAPGEEPGTVVEPLPEPDSEIPVVEEPTEEPAPTNDPALLAEAEKYLTYAEKYGSSFYKKKALEAINLLVDGEDKSALQARYAAL